MSTPEKADGAAEPATSGIGVAVLGLGNVGSEVVRIIEEEQLVAKVADYDIDESGIVRVHSVNVRGFATLPTTVVAR